MMTDEEITDVADWFWHLAGHGEPFPRSLETSVCRALPLAIVKLPRLDVDLINDYLQRRRMAVEIDAPSRPLRACLLARSGAGMVFIDGADHADQQRFSLAHEVAHFLLDHLRPRQQAIDALGPEIQDILDGRRPPTPSERLSALLQDISFGRLEHLMQRGHDGLVADRRTIKAEDCADRLALEILAPSACVKQSLTSMGAHYQDAERVVEETLITEYGLPGDVARAYARYLCARQRPAPTFRQWLQGEG